MRYLALSYDLLSAPPNRSGIYPLDARLDNRLTQAIALAYFQNHKSKLYR